MKVIITKYALSSGIQVLEGNTSEAFPTMFTPDRKLGFMVSFHSNDWHRGRQTALEHVVKMVNRRRTSLKKQLAELDTKADKALKAIEAADLT